MPRTVLRTVKRGRDWWVEGRYLDEPVGPYDTKADADEDRRGMEATIKDSIKNKEGIWE